MVELILQMKLLKNLTSKFFLALLLLSMAMPCFANSKMAVVDLAKIYQDYYLVKEASLKIEEVQESLKRILLTAETEMKELSTKYDAESVAKKSQSSIDDKVEEFHDVKEDYNRRINANIQNAVDKIAAEQGFVAILDKSVSLFDVNDVTSEVLTRLEKVKK